MELTHTLTMDSSELMFLCDQFSTLMPWPEELYFNPGDFLRKVGRGLELVAGSRETTLIEVTVGEAWMIREYAKSYATLGTDQVGLSLKMKSYEAIFALEAAEGEIPMATMPEFMKEFEEEDLV